MEIWSTYMDLSFAMTKPEEKTRKRWLFATFSYFILYPLALCGFLAFLSRSGSKSVAILVVFLVCGIIKIFPMLLIWHCAYRKYGTKLLTFWLVIWPLPMFALILGIFAKSVDVGARLYFLIEFAFFVWWFLVSLKMRAVNKSIKERLSFKNAEAK
jgi:hypothetical protein